VIFPNQQACEEILAILAKFDREERDLMLQVVQMNLARMRETDPWSMTIAAYLDDRPEQQGFELDGIFTFALGMSFETASRGDVKRVAAILAEQGLVRARGGRNEAGEYVVIYRRMPQLSSGREFVLTAEEIEEKVSAAIDTNDVDAALAIVARLASMSVMIRARFFPRLERHFGFSKADFRAMRGEE
jgi:hypothetical protein